MRFFVIAPLFALIGCSSPSTQTATAPVALPTMASPFSADRVRAIQSSSSSNLKILGLAILQYSQDHNEGLPDMSSPESMRDDLLAFFKADGDMTPPSTNNFRHPETREFYLPNPSLSKVKLESIKDATSRVLLYEASADSDKTRAVLFVDGSVERIYEEDFAKIKSASKIP